MGRRAGADRLGLGRGLNRQAARVLSRYLLLQLPSWILLTLVLLAIRSWRDLSGWLVVAVVGAWVLKDLVLFPFVRHAYDPARPRTQAERLVDLPGTAERDLDPDGWVRVRGELWSASVAGEAGPVRRGERVRVCGIDGMRLLVEREPRPPDASPDPGGSAQRSPGRDLSG